MAKSFNHKSNSYPNGPSHLPLQQQADDSLAGSFLVSLWVSALAGVNKKVIDVKFVDLKTQKLTVKQINNLKKAKAMHKNLNPKIILYLKI